MFYNTSTCFFIASGVSSRLQALQSQLLQVQVEKNEMIQKGKEADQQIEFLGTVIQDLQVTHATRVPHAPHILCMEKLEG